MLEAVSVVFAVLIALGVDEWRENRQYQELAERALGTIQAELAANREELASSMEANRTLRDRVSEAARDTVLPEDFNINYEYSLVSSSAWETAQVTQATQFMDLERVQRLARIYNLQGLFVTSQDHVMDFILGIGEVAEQNPERIPRLMRGRLTNAVGMQELLIAAYDSTLVSLGEAAR
ncbi:MAG TPA: hypothetical protein VLA43_21305 [Longimicrobiales bacterium]|nr:hypothetical protein [Longimicrobiales bacterium]